MMTASENETVDVLIVGSGAGAMTAAIKAYDAGLKVLMIEKSDLYGGSSAMSGGALWVPNNPLMKKKGVSDSREDSLQYLTTLSGGDTEVSRLESYVDHSPRMVKYLLENSRLRLDSLERYPDYYPEAKGGKPGGRSMEPKSFWATELGGDFARLRPSHPQELMFGKIGLTARESHVLVCGGWRSYFLAFFIMMRYMLNFSARKRSKRDTRLTLGNALVGSLRASMQDREIPLWLNTSLIDLCGDDSQIDGAVVSRNGREIKVVARRGVILAAGGFARNLELRKKYQQDPISIDWTAANPKNTGDLYPIFDKLRIPLKLMEEAWWTPVTLVPGKEFSWLLVVEKSMPGSILVNARGKRFTNEAAPYVDVVNGMYREDETGLKSVPAFLIFDARYRRNYPCGPFAPGRVQPDKSLPRKYREHFFKKATSLDALAHMLGIDPEGLKETIQRFNGDALEGVDPDYQRGESLYDRYYSDPRISPNPCLAPIVEPPYYAIEVFPGDLGTKGGVLTDRAGRVLNDAQQPIVGLYATGNCTASMMGKSYPGAGGTIGPAMTFGFLAAEDMAAGNGHGAESQSTAA